MVVSRGLGFIEFQVEIVSVRVSLSPSRALLAGNLASLAAAAVIAYLLLVVLGEGYTALFRPPHLYAAASLIPVGVAALAFYSRLAKNMVAPGAAAIALASAGLTAGIWEPLAGGGLLVAAYAVELLAARSLYDVLATVSRVGAVLFALGVTMFTATLPLLLLAPVYALAPLAGDLVKTVGLLAVALRRRPLGLVVAHDLVLGEEH